MKLMPLADIQIDNRYLRLDTNIESLKRSIETIGLINPVTVNEQGELLAGGRRFAAVRALGWTNIPVNVLDRTVLEQELISIDENLVRKPLQGLELEHCLNRGREIYELLNPEARKVELDPLAKPPRAERPKPRPADEETPPPEEQPEPEDDSFVAVTARKTGLSPKSIESAIRRDALSSDLLKESRAEVGASRTNELIKLPKDHQDKLLPYVRELPVREVKVVVQRACEGGVEQAIEVSQSLKPLPRELMEIQGLTRRLTKVMERTIEQPIACEPEQRAAVDEDLKTLLDTVQAYFEGLAQDEGRGRPTEALPALSVEEEARFDEEEPPFGEEPRFEDEDEPRFAADEEEPPFDDEP